MLKSHLYFLLCKLPVLILCPFLLLNSLKFLKCPSSKESNQVSFSHPLGHLEIIWTVCKWETSHTSSPFCGHGATHRQGSWGYALAITPGLGWAPPPNGCSLQTHHWSHRCGEVRVRSWVWRLFACNKAPAGFWAEAGLLEGRPEWSLQFSFSFLLGSLVVSQIFNNKGQGWGQGLEQSFSHSRRAAWAAALSQSESLRAGGLWVGQSSSPTQSPSCYTVSS